TVQQPVTAPPAAATTPPAAQPPRPAERTAATPLTALAGDNDVTQMTADLPPGDDRNGHHSSSAASHSAPTSPTVPTTMTTVSAQSKDQIMQNYLTSMDQFLQIQQQMYSTFLQTTTTPSYHYRKTEYTCYYICRN